MPDSEPQPTGMPDDRWQDLIRSMDPVANLSALADVWRQAAASSEQVVSDFVGGNGEATSDRAAGENAPFSVRDVQADFERSVDQLAAAAKRFFNQMPWGIGGPADRPEATPTVTVLDGVGTTEISLPVGDSEPTSHAANSDQHNGASKGPWATDLVRHDGSRITCDQVVIRPTPDFGESPATSAAERSFIVKITVDHGTEPGIYHGQVLCPGAMDFVLPLEARVYAQDDA